MNPITLFSDSGSSQHHVFLSPHYDDIALSCGGTAAILAARGEPVDIALIFGDFPDERVTLTPFAAQMHNLWGMAAETVIDSRRHEELNASTILGATDHYLPFLDAIYRSDLYLNDDALFGSLPEVETGVSAQIVDAIETVARGGKQVRYYAPLAIANHVDHQLAFEAGRLLAISGGDVVFYEDLPYALIPGKLDDRLAQIGEQMADRLVVDVSAAWKKKIDAIMAYPSQLDVIFGGNVGVGKSRRDIDGAMRSYAEMIGGGIAAERFWRLKH